MLQKTIMTFSADVLEFGRSSDVHQKYFKYKLLSKVFILVVWCWKKDRRDLIQLVINLDHYFIESN